MMNTKQQLVLLVEDNQEDIFFIKRVFNKHLDDYNLVDFDNSSDAISYLKGVDTANIPALVLLDIKLISGTGFEVLKFIKNDSHLQNIPTVMMSSSDRIKDIKKAHLLGANDYVQKIRTYSELQTKLPTLVKSWVKY